MNLMKSYFVLCARCLQARSRCVSTIIGMHCKDLPIDYLGCKLFRGRSKVAYFQSIVDKVNKRLVEWPCRLLSIGRRMLLIKHVFTAIPLHTMAALDPPK